jgi:hypothetical protein
VGHVAIAGDDLEALDCLIVANDIVEEDGAVFLYPARSLVDVVKWS